MNRSFLMVKALLVMRLASRGLTTVVRLSDVPVIPAAACGKRDVRPG